LRGIGKNRKRRADLLLIGALVLLACALLLWQGLSRRPGTRAVVYVDGQAVASYPLDVPTRVRLETEDGSSFNVLVIEDGRADVVDAGCPDRLCVRMHSIRRTGESIICLPNRTEIRIEGGEPEVDLG